jgi:hypothetical protein
LTGDNAPSLPCLIHASLNHSNKREGLQRGWRPAISRKSGEYVTRCAVLRCDGQPYTPHVRRKILSRRLTGNFWNIHPISLTLSRLVDPLRKHLETLPTPTIMGKWKWLFANGCRRKIPIFTAKEVILTRTKLG